MSAVIPISDSILVLTDKIEDALRNQLPTYCSARDTADYPLPAPADHAYFVGDDTIDSASEHLGNPDIFCRIHYSPSDLQDRGTGDSTKESYNQVTTVLVSIVLRQPAGFDLPTRNGRDLTMSEWMRIRAEKYRGILADILPKFCKDGTNIHQVDLTGAATSDTIEEDTGIYRECTVSVECVQHVEVNL